MNNATITYEPLKGFCINFHGNIIYDHNQHDYIACEITDNAFDLVKSGLVSENKLNDLLFNVDPCIVIDNFSLKKYIKKNYKYPDYTTYPQKIDKIMIKIQETY